MASTYNVTDRFGNRYEYTLCLFDGAWNEIPGIYIFVKWGGTSWVPLYIGQAESFKNRLCASHECWSKAVALGATHVLARHAPNAMARSSEEQRLIETYNPPLNVQHNRSFGGA
jgi:hypothetical protein